VSAVFSADGARILTIGFGGDNTAKVWDTATGEVLLTITLLLEHFGSFEGNIAGAFSPDGSGILIGSSDGTATLWNAETGEQLRTFEGHRDPVWCVAFSPDGGQVATGSGGWEPGDDNTVILWNADTGEKLRTLAGHKCGITNVAFSPDGNQIVTSAAGTGTSWVWDTTTGEILRTFYKGSGDPKACTATFSPNGSQILTTGGYSDPTAILWDASTGEKLRTFAGHTIGLRNAVFSSDGMQILTGSADGTAMLWDISDLAAPSEVSTDEWVPY
jgi:WD40 repeat protein